MDVSRSIRICLQTPFDRDGLNRHPQDVIEYLRA